MKVLSFIGNNNKPHLFITHVVGYSCDTKCFISQDWVHNGCNLFASCLGLFVMSLALDIELTEVYILYFAIKSNTD